MEFLEQMEEDKMSSLASNVESGSTEEMDKPFLDVAQFFLDNDETNEIRVDDATEKHPADEEEEEEEVSRLTSRAFKTFTPVQLKADDEQHAVSLDPSKSFIPITSPDVEEEEEEGHTVCSPVIDSLPTHFESEICYGTANPLLFLSEEEELYPPIERDFLSLPGGAAGAFQDDLLLAGEGDLFVDEANFFNFSSHELEERERETPSPANVDTEKEDEGEGEEQIKMEDKARRTISPLQLHAPETPKIEQFKEELKSPDSSSCVPMQEDKVVT